MTLPKMLPVESSNVAAVGWDEAEGRLLVRFRAGAEYEYLGVSAEEAARIAFAPSVGRALRAFGKRGRRIESGAAS